MQQTKVWTTSSLRNTQSATDAQNFLNDPANKVGNIISVTSEAAFDPGNGIWHTIYIVYREVGANESIAMNVPSQNLEEFANGGAEAVFCDVWPLVRKGLVALENKDPKLKKVIDVLITAGDDAATIICH